MNLLTSVKELELLRDILNDRDDATICDRRKISPDELKKRKKRLLSAVQKRIEKHSKCAELPPGGGWSRVPKPKIESHVTTWKHSVCKHCGIEIKVPSWERDLEVGESGGGATEHCEWGFCGESCMHAHWEKDRMKSTRRHAHIRSENWEAPKNETQA